MKKIFPKEFSDLLNKNGVGILKRFSQVKPLHRVKVIQDIIEERYSRKIFSALDTHIYPRLKDFYSPVQKKWMTETKRNFQDKIGKSMKLKSAIMNSPLSDSFKIAHEIGLIEMLNSESFRRTGEIVLNSHFGARIGKQIICYDDFGYVSPHTDYLPEFPNLKNGYYDIHLMFSNQKVKHQFLVYENSGFLNNIVDISSPSALAVYHLPFWHYTTPLTPINEKRGGARRWLILASFEED